MKIALLGFARENKSVLKFLKKSRHYQKAQITVCDKNSNIKAPRGVAVQTGKNYLKNLATFDLAFRTPGLPYLSPQIQQAQKQGTIISSQTKLFFDEARKTGCTLIGITGTKGKGTTSTLLYWILKVASGKQVFLAGNIGTPMLDILPKLNQRSIVILELSSFQLQDLHQSPPIAVILEIFPDHLDAHRNLREYIDAKANIARWQSPRNRIFYFTHDKYSRWIGKQSPGKKIGIGALFRDSPVMEKKLRENISIPGNHNLRNARMAASVALALGCPLSKVLRAVKKFSGNEHRLELVRTIKNVKIYNDSASTNPQTTAAAIRAFKGPNILIAGGKDKNLNYSPLSAALSRSVALIILLGENRLKIKRAISRFHRYVTLRSNLRSAVDAAYQTAKKLNKPVNILFSPGSTSFDMFRDYKDRGEQFKKIVRGLK